MAGKAPISAALNETEPHPRITLGALFGAFLKVSMYGFGGPIVWARRIIVEERGWLGDAEFADILSFCQFLPGPNVVSVTVCIGARFRGHQVKTLGDGCLATFDGPARAIRCGHAITDVARASGLEVRASMSSTARSYSAHRARLRQSSAVSLCERKGSRSRVWKRRSCSSLERWSQNFWTTMPNEAWWASNSLISS